MLTKRDRRKKQKRKSLLSSVLNVALCDAIGVEVNIMYIIGSYIRVYIEEGGVYFQYRGYAVRERAIVYIPINKYPR